MSIPILSTKLYIPTTRSNVVSRPRLIERLNEGLHRRLTVISSTAGSGKTTLVSEWLMNCELQACWLSLDEGDNDTTRFLKYLSASLRTLTSAMNNRVGMNELLLSTQPPPIESILTALINEITAIAGTFVLVLDDYHIINAREIDNAIAFLLEHMPPQMHLVITTREDPRLPMARLRVRGQLTEVRATDLRFTSSETAEFLGQVMRLNLSSEDIDLLESRTEGWIAGLQLAAISMQGLQDTTSFIKSFTGSDRFVLDYLVEEVLQQQTASIQDFLLRSSILDRLCGPLCDAVLGGESSEYITSSTSGQVILQQLERANLFIIPLDNERRWYRYHHLFADLLKKRLQESITSSNGNVEAELHIRASQWYEDNDLEIEAFHHAVSAHDVDRATCLMEGEGMPLHFRGAVAPVLKWLNSMTKVELDARPSLWVMYASALLMVGQITGIEQKLRAAEEVLQGVEQDVKILDLIGHIASIRATLAVSKHESETIIAESNRALQYLHPDNLPVRTATTWTLGYAYQLQGDRSAASNAYTKALSISELIGHVMVTFMATLGLGLLQEADNHLYEAAETYQRVLKLAGNPPLPAACEAHLGLARIFYEWNDLETAQQHGQESIQLAQQLEQTDRVVAGEVILARLMLAQGDVSGAAAMLAKADHFACQRNFVSQITLIAETRVLVLLHQGNLSAATHLVQKHELNISKVRVHLAQGDSSAALVVLESLRRQAETKGLEDDRLKIMVLQAVALYAQGNTLKAMKVLVDVLTMAELGGFNRIFVDEGISMNRLLREAATHGMMHDYIEKLLAVFEVEEEKGEVDSDHHLNLPAKLIEPLSGRELEVLHLVAQGLSNREISERLFLALSSVKGHNRSIFDKLQVKRRTEAIACARKLGLL